MDDGQSQTFTDLPSGDYDVTEILPTGWKLSEASCTGGDFDGITDGLTVHLGAAEDITCTFKNETIVKIYFPLIFLNHSATSTNQAGTLPTKVIEDFLLEDILLIDAIQR